MFNSVEPVFIPMQHSLNIIYPGGSYQVVAVPLQYNIMLPSSLYLIQFHRLENFPQLSELISSQFINGHLVALLYENVIFHDTASSFKNLESYFTGNSADHHMLIAEAANPYDNQTIYILAHYSDKKGLGSIIPDKSIGLFSFTVNQLIGCEPYSKDTYIHYVNQARVYLTQQVNSLYNQLFQSNHIVFNLMMQNTQLRRQLNEPKTASEESSAASVNSNSDIYECVLCRAEHKNTVFLPCGHVLACKQCVTNDMRLPLNKAISRRPTPRCPLCMQLIKQVKEVFI